MKWYERVWYGKHPLRFLLLPLTWAFAGVVAGRRTAFRIGLLAVRRFPVPVVVVGNISVGGTGKTPLTIWLARFLVEQGRRPGIVARGYGGHASQWPQKVRPDSDPGSVGDEAVLLARLSGCPVCVGPDRPAAVDALLRHTDCDVIISDDGLQHYRLGRDIEVVVIDGERRFGNGLLLPAGPLREPIRRAARADLRVCNGIPRPGELAMRLSDAQVLPLAAAALPDAATRPLRELAGQRVHAVAGLGNCQRFFDLLKARGLRLIEHPFPDHHAFGAEDIDFDDDLPVLMTDKDGVKCARFAQHRHWVVRIEMTPDPEFGRRMMELLEKIDHGHQTA